MDSSPSDVPRIPLLSKPLAQLPGGLNANHLSAAAAEPHPVAHLQASTGEPSNPYRDLAHVRHAYGSALAMILATERKVAQDQMTQGRYYLRASGGGGGYGGSGGDLYGEICSGQDVQLHWEDVLGRPEDRPDLAAGSPHAVMERQLNMTM